MSASLSVFSKEDAQNNPTFAVASTNKRKANDYQDRGSTLFNTSRSAARMSIAHFRVTIDKYIALALSIPRLLYPPSSPHTPESLVKENV
jgi:hypothetical protein